mmetsp:Transcript_7087/g.7261  ORF Transcript_7087/g.7261 Transcript_7087/m.7261 type:complete len:253 (-) Transcript_7087:659-1417(-)
MTSSRSRSSVAMTASTSLALYVCFIFFTKKLYSSSGLACASGLQRLLFHVGTRHPPVYTTNYSKHIISDTSHKAHHSLAHNHSYYPTSPTRSHTLPPAPPPTDRHPTTSSPPIASHSHSPLPPFYPPHHPPPRSNPQTVINPRIPPLLDVFEATSSVGIGVNSLWNYCSWSPRGTLICRDSRESRGRPLFDPDSSPWLNRSHRHRDGLRALCQRVRQNRPRPRTSTTRWNPAPPHESSACQSPPLAIFRPPV